MKHQHTAKLAAGALLALAAVTAQAAEITLRAVSAFGMDTFFSQRFKQFVDKVNTEGKGIMQIQVVGGPESMPPFEVGSAVRAGVVDLANTTGVFHSNLVPEALTLSISEKRIDALRANGGHALMDRIHRDKANMVWVARISDGLQYHVYTTRPVTSADLSGMKLRSVPVYRPFFQALGATPLQVPPGEVYTALERGMVDGYGWPSTGILDLGWHEKTKYRIEPGFYNVEVGLYMNQDTWNRLDDAQRTFLDKQVQWVESLNAAELELGEAEKRRQAEVGIETITLPADEAEKFRAKAYEAGWQAIAEASPQNVEALRELFGAD
ncbi:MAG TPA: TRAP transporter substrate-binding protein DctP [Rhodocyclaceae bacterium]|nr:TRAP transporter substrate-binding protein DctP [Rhodocyclaceae bacterium]